jgi:hypothetical protein
MKTYICTQRIRPATAVSSENIRGRKRIRKKNSPRLSQDTNKKKSFWKFASKFCVQFCTAKMDGGGAFSGGILAFDAPYYFLLLLGIYPTAKIPTYMLRRLKQKIKS